MVAMLIACGLRRGELLALQLESIQQREEHWGDRESGRQGRTRADRSYPYLGEEPRRRVNSCGRHHVRSDVPSDQQGRSCLGDGMSAKVLCDVVRAAAARAGIDRLAPTTCDENAPVSVASLAANSIRSI